MFAPLWIDRSDMGIPVCDPSFLRLAEFERLFGMLVRVSQKADEDILQHTFHLLRCCQQLRRGITAQPLPAGATPPPLGGDCQQCTCHYTNAE